MELTLVGLKLDGQYLILGRFLKNKLEELILLDKLLVHI